MMFIAGDPIRAALCRAVSPYRFVRLTSIRISSSSFTMSSERRITACGGCEKEIYSFVEMLTLRGTYSDLMQTRLSVFVHCVQVSALFDEQLHRLFQFVCNELDGHI
jgi:hypothetical protein